MICQIINESIDDDYFDNQSFKFLFQNCLIFFSSLSNMENVLLISVLHNIKLTIFGIWIDRTRH